MALCNLNAPPEGRRHGFSPPPRAPAASTDPHPTGDVHWSLKTQAARRLTMTAAAPQGEPGAGGPVAAASEAGIRTWASAAAGPPARPRGVECPAARVSRSPGAQQNRL
ncbi:hypothetical protein GH733_012764 [Mirounga leonina]|nr:hypothetical protein GH733_012764 [Mirounga leonina]